MRVMKSLEYLWYSLIIHTAICICTYILTGNLFISIDFLITVPAIAGLLFIINLNLKGIADEIKKNK